jgi:hypothetical protein
MVELAVILLQHTILSPGVIETWPVGASICPQEFSKGGFTSAIYL